MEGGDIPEAKRARRSPSAAETPSEKEPRHAAKQQHQQQHLQQQQQVGVQEDSTPAAGAGSRSMTARPEGAPDEGEEDTLFDDPEEGLGEELEGLLRIEPQSTSSDPVVAQINEHAAEHPETIREFIEQTAARLANDSGCTHVEPLVTWKEDRTATTCGQYQAHILSEVDMQEVLKRQVNIDGDPGFCLAKRVRNQVYYDTSKALQCTGKNNQCKAGVCMVAALRVYAGVGEEGMPVETVRALCKY